MSRRTNERGVLVGLYDLVIWYMQRMECYPKSSRIALGDRTDNKLLDMLELSVRARDAKDPQAGGRAQAQRLVEETRLALVNCDPTTS